MKIGRTISPAAAPIGMRSLFHGLIGIAQGRKYLESVEKELKLRFGVKHVFLLSSGKAALMLILKALSVLHPEKDEVLIPAYTCFSVPSAIVKAGLKVALCDINTDTFDFNYQLLEESIGEKTLCVVPDHLFGIPADMDRIATLCRAKGVFIVEDAAQAMGGSYRGRQLGTIGDVGVFSLGRGKNLTCGSGGVIITNSAQIAKKIREEYQRLRWPSPTENLKEFLKVVCIDLFIRPSLFWFPAGISFLKLGETIFYKDFPVKKLSGMQAGLLDNWQVRLCESNEARRKSARWFIDALYLEQRSDEIPYLRLPILVHKRESRESVLSLSRQTGLGISAMYPTPIHEIAELKEQFKGESFHAAREVSQKLLTIPTHQFVTHSDREKIAALGTYLCG